MKQNKLTPTCILATFTTLLLTLVSARTAWCDVELGSLGRTPPTQDPMIGYQWSLFNNGQKVITDLDGIHSRTYLANPKFSLGWKNHDSQMKKDVVVAIIDSGIDTAHPDLKGRILPGKSFSDRDVTHDTLVDDDVGHGTHLAGIIAALVNNAEGISGMSNRIKILPLKIHDQGELAGARRAKTALTARFRRAVDFAIESKVDVINISMGWPRAADSLEIEASIEKAIKAGVVVVAAAGNDHHDVQIFPCAYKGVVCVGGANIDGTTSEATNFGGHVDLLAPGQWVLSTYPSVMTSILFGVKGYEYWSGSSQAAAFVSGAFAILKGLFPDETVASLRARVLGSALAVKRHEPVLFGQLNLEAAVASEKPYAAPVFKKIEEGVVNLTTRKFMIPIPVEGQLTQAPQVRSLSSGVTLTTKTAPDGSYFADGLIENLNVGNHLNYEILLNGKQFKHSVILTHSIENDKTQNFDINVDGLKDLAEVGRVSRPDLTYTDHFWASLPGENKMTLYKWTGERKASHTFEGVAAPLRDFSLLEWGSPGQFIYAGVKLNELAEPTDLFFYYLDSDLNIQRQFHVQNEGVILTSQGISAGNFSGINVPVFWDRGLIPAADKNPNSFVFEKNQEEKRIYFFEPKADIFVTRTLTASLFRAKMGKQAEALALLPQSAKEREIGLLKVLIFKGEGIVGQHFILEISDLKDWQDHFRLIPLNVGSNDLARNMTSPGWNLNLGFDVFPDMQGIYSEISARSILISGAETLENKSLKTELPERIGNIIKTFTRGTNILTLFETTRFIRAQGTWNGQPIDAKVASATSSFLPGYTFRQLAMPVTTGANHQPGFIVDNSPLFSRAVEVYTLEKNEFKATVRNSFSLPADCINQNPGLQRNGQSVMTFLCKTQNGFRLRHFSL
jgi:hypothetical protein